MSKPLGILLVLTLAASSCSGSGDGDAASSAVPSSSSTTTSAPSTSTTTAPTTTSITTTTTEPPPPTTAECLATADTPALVGQIVIATITQGGIVELTAMVVDGTLGGIVLLGQADSGIADAIAPLYAGDIPPIVGVDEEGGVVQRLGLVLGYDPSARSLGDSGDAGATFATGRERGSGSASLGFNMVFAPVLDLGRSAGIRSRTYGDSPEIVSSFAMAYANGLEAGGVVAVAKHFPGHGSTGVDSHNSLPTTSPLADLVAADLVPFEAAAINLEAIMMGHLDVPGLTDGMPASLSAAAVRLLRDDYGFGGLVVSDDLSMGALSQWTVAEAAVLAVIAGEDLLIAGGLRHAVDAVEGLIAAVDEGRIDRPRLAEAAGRVLATKGVDPCEVWPL